MKKPWIIVLVLVVAVLAVAAVSTFAILSTQKTTVAPETSKADIAPVTQIVNLDNAKITLVKNNKEVLPTDNIVAGELYEISGKLASLPNSVYGDQLPISYNVAFVGITLWFRNNTNDKSLESEPVIFARVRSDKTFSFKFVVADTQDIGKYVQLSPSGVYEGRTLTANLNSTSGNGYLGSSSMVVKR